MAACPGVGEPLRSLSLSLYPFLPPYLSPFPGPDRNYSNREAGSRSFNRPMSCDGAPQAALDQAGPSQKPVSIMVVTYQAMVDSGSNQTSNHQSLIQSAALDTGRIVKVRCVHGDVVNYPLVSLAIQF